MEDGRLCVAEAESGKTLWCGYVAGHPVRTVLPVPPSTDCIVLLAWYPAKSSGDFRNVLRRRKDGSIVWRAQLPATGPRRSEDYYTEIGWDTNGTLQAYSWSAYSVHLDPNTGKILNQEWVK